jgi:hypothetical protein
MAASTLVMRTTTFLTLATASITSAEEGRSGRSPSSLLSRITFAAAADTSKNAFFSSNGWRSCSESMPNSGTLSTASMLVKTGEIFARMARASFCFAATALADSLSLCFFRASLALFSNGLSSCG